MVKLLDILKELLEEKKADRCLRIARQRYDKPSAYRSGAIVRCRRGEIWKGIKEGEEVWEKEYIELEIASEELNIPIDKIKQAFENSQEIILTDNIWQQLENTESFDCWGDWDCVENIAKTYNRTSPTILKAAIESGEYDRPLILKYTHEDEERYWLVAGNTRLSTAAAMKVYPKVVVGTIEALNEEETLHKWFSRKGGSGGSKGWVDCNTCREVDGKTKCKPCGRQKGETR